MSTNFDFIGTEWPEIHADCVRAEGYGRTDPRSSVFYARRVVEQIVRHIYVVEKLPEPYKADLAARISDAGFKKIVGPQFGSKADLIRRVGNTGVHETKVISEMTALNLLRELHHVVVWSAFRYSTAPDRVPTSAAYDPSLIPAPQAAGAEAPLSTAELNALLTKFAEKDAAIEAERGSNASLQAQIVELRAQIAAAQAAKVHTVDDHNYDEAATRQRLIDLYLGEAGWALDQKRDREYPLTGMPTPGGTGFADYVLWGGDGLPLAVVEAKRSSKDATVGQHQARAYADALEQMTGQRPVIFYSNGYEHWLWDDAAGYPPRQVSGFFTKGDLELMVQRRQSRLPLAGAPIDKEIVGRHYQLRAIRAVDAALEKNEREALLVMATGSGKSRTVIALVDQLMKANWVKKVLFLADRTALVKQAANAFKTHLDHVATVNLLDDKVSEARVYVSTYPTLMGLIDEAHEGVRKFGPGYFDLIVIDEAHRSVYQKYRHIFDYFDAMLVGLTATPKDEIDHNTYSLFGLEDGVPTDAYSLDEAVAEGYLVPPVGVSVPLKFMDRGIRYDDLPEDEKDQWDSLEWSEEGEIPDYVDPEKLNRFLFNADTVDKVLETLMKKGHKIAGGDRIGKTIIFAKNQRHAQFIQQRFDKAYPWLEGTHAQVITSSVEGNDRLIEKFATPDAEPHIAISVDMLDTGIDVPEVLNLVFFKLVRAKSKFWQMIGRGTRLCPDLYGPGEDKTNFYVFDFCQNLEFFSQPEAGSEGSMQKSLSQRLFEARVALLLGLEGHPAAYDGAGDGTESVGGLRADTAAYLREVVEAMNVDNFIVRPQRQWVERYSTPASWKRLTPQAAGDAAMHLAGLPSAVTDGDETAKRFDLIMLRTQLAQLDDDLFTAERLRRTVQDIAGSLLSQTSIPAVAAQTELLENLSTDEWWVDVTLPMLELARRRMRGLVAFLPKAQKKTVYTDFKDELGEQSIVELPGVSVGTDWERFKAKTRAYLKDHEDNVALQRLRRNRQLTSSDLSALEQVLVEAGAAQPDIDKATEESLGLGLFIRSLVGLDREAASEAFSAYLEDGKYTVDQIRFVNLIVEDLTANGHMAAARLFESPYTDDAPQGPLSLFPERDVEGLVTILNTVRSNAAPESSIA
ncbi:type I restriction enzyme R subunit [Terracoccus luteus]|uniref:Type I restriction enzyme R subunit n=1 Tax=Terracoccus luteus TaxID=53356 RepID=A0A495XVR6_9MICO|nr:DEAD/DEAH box helicase family protein [Terracoccus luteus]RKT78670.1 type I restriction enzyme R subunit [Terracoccus luteus]